MGDHWVPLLVVLVIGMVFFGAKRLPEMGSALGKTIREFQKSMREVSDSPSTPAPVVTPPVDRAQLTSPAAATLAAPAAPQQPTTPSIEG